MQFRLAVAALAAASSVIGTYVTVSADVTAVDSAATALNTAVQKIDGTSAAAALTVQGKFTDLLNAVKKLGSDADDEAKAFTKTQSQKIVDSLTKTEKTVKKITTKLSKIAKAAKKSGIASIISGDLSDAKTAVDAAGKSLVAKANSAVKADAKALIKAYDADLSVAIKAYA